MSWTAQRVIAVALASGMLFAASRAASTKMPAESVQGNVPNAGPPNLPTASQATATWIPGTGNWNVAANWNPPVVPTNGTGTTYNVLVDGGVTGVNSVVTLNISATIDNLTIDAGDTLALNPATTLNVVAGAGAGTIANAGSLIMNGTGGAPSYLRPGAGDVTLSGAGTLTLANTGGNYIRGVSGSDRLINQDNTIQGAGFIGANLMALTNQGTIDANQTNRLCVDPNAAGVTNAATMRASSGGTLQLADGTFTNTGGIIQALDNSVVELSQALIVGGTLTVSGSGIVRQINDSTLESLTNAASITLNPSTILTLKGTISNTGSISVDGNPGAPGYIYVAPGDVTLSGAGTVTLAAAGGNMIRGTGSTERLINQDNTIQGAGYIGGNLTALTNHSLIDANQTVALWVDPNVDGVTNTATMQASNGGTLRLQPGTFTNTGGIVQALDTSVVEVNQALIVGGTLTASGSGIIRQVGSSTLESLTNAAPITLNPSTILTLKGTISNTGSIALDGNPGAPSYIYVAPGDVTLSGAGTVTLAAAGGNMIRGTGSTERLVNQDNTIQGAGYIGGNLMALTNHSLIDANQTVALWVDPSADGVTNTATMQASNGGTLRLQPGTFTNTGGIIQALDASVVELNQALIVGGTLTVSGSGIIRQVGSSTLESLTNAAPITLNPATILTLKGTISNTGSISVDGNTGAPSCIYVAPGDVTLSGAGTVTLAAVGGNMIRGAGNTERLINQDNTIQGAGYIGSGLMALTNRGLVDANQANSLTVYPNTTGAINAGTMRATTGGTLILYGRAFTNSEGGTSGLIRADNATAKVQSATITGGNVDVVGAGQIELSSSTITGANVAVDARGVLRATAGINSLAGSGTCTDNGTIAAIGGTLNVSMDVSGTGGWTADGTGTIRFASGVDALTAGGIAISTNGLVELNGANLGGSFLSMGPTAQLTVATGSSVTLSDDLTFAMTTESKLSWASGTVLTMTGGIERCNPGWWASLEVGGADNGPATGYSNNFDLSNLVIAAGAAVVLVDQKDNGNRNQSGGSAEALYVDNLTIGSGAKLHLNGLHLYVGGVQMTAGSYGDGQVVDGTLARAPDYDCDNDVDLTDFGHFQACFNGPNRPPAETNCGDAEMDSDGDVDLADFGILQACFNGPNRPPTCG